jgi:hypothetical protein
MTATLFSQDFSAAAMTKKVGALRCLQAFCCSPYCSSSVGFVFVLAAGKFYRQRSHAIVRYNNALQSNA